MPRLTKIFINISTDEVFDGVTGDLISNNSYPYISSKEKAQYSIQYVTAFESITEYTEYDGFAGQTTSSSAVVDNDYNHIDKGELAVGVTASAPITTISIVKDSLSNIPQPSGFVRLINAGSQSETIEYTSVVTNGLNYDFTVDITPLYSYAITDTAATNDPPLMKATDVDIDSTDSDTGLFVVTISANSLPFLLEIEGNADIAGCIFEHQVKDDLGNKIFESRFTFVCNNSLDDDGVLPPPDSFNWYTSSEVDALLSGKVDKVPTATVGNAAVFTADGGIKDGGEAGTGDMTKIVFDKQNVNDDAFLTANHNRSILNLVDADFTANTRTLSSGEIGKLVSINLVAGAGTYAVEVPNLTGIERAKTTTINYASGTQPLDITTVGGTQEIGGETTQSISEGGKRIDIVANGTQYDISNDDRAEGGEATTDDCGVDTGVEYGLDVSINANTSKVDISSGAIFIRDYMTDPENPVYKKCIYDGETAKSLTYLATKPYTQFVAVEDLPSNPGKVRIEQLGGTEESVPYYKDKVKLQGAIHFDNVSIFSITTTKQLAYNKVNDLVQYSVANGAVINGVTITDNGASDLSCTQTAGTAVAVDINSVGDTRYSSDKSFSEVQASFIYNYRANATDFEYETNATSVLKPSLYNNLSTNTVDAVPAGKFTIQRNFFFPISNTNGIAYGQKLYDSQEEAIADLQNGFIEAPTFEDGVLVTAIICKSGAISTQNQADILFAQAKRESFDTGLTNISIRPGFLDVDKSEFSYDNGTRTLTLSPIAPETTIKVRLFNGTIIEQASFSWTNTDVEGLHYFYLDDEGVEKTSSGLNRESIYNFLKTTVSASFIAWGNASFSKANIVTDFRKRATGMSPDTTAKNFFDIEVYSLDGTAVTDFPVLPDGSTPTDAQFGFATDELLIGDRQFNFPPFSRGDTWRVLYMEGSNVRHIDKPAYAFLTGQDFGLVNDYPVYNNSGTPAEAIPPNVNSPQYVYCIMGVTNEIDPTKRMLTWMGENVYISQETAKEGLANEISRVESLSGIKQEFRAIYAVLYEVDLDYTNTHSVVALDISQITSESSVGGTSSIPSGLGDGSNADGLHKHEAQALQASTLGVNDVAGTIYRAVGDGTTEKVDFDTEVSGNSAVTANTAKTGITAQQITDIGLSVKSDITGISGADAIINMVSLTQAEYNAIGTPNTQTIFNITDA